MQVRIMPGGKVARGQYGGGDEVHLPPFRFQEHKQKAEKEILFEVAGLYQTKKAENLNFRLFLLFQ